MEDDAVNEVPVSLQQFQDEGTSNSMTKQDSWTRRGGNDIDEPLGVRPDRRQWCGSPTGGSAEARQIRRNEADVTRHPLGNHRKAERSSAIAVDGNDGDRGRGDFGFNDGLRHSGVKLSAATAPRSGRESNRAERLVQVG